MNHHLNRCTRVLFLLFFILQFTRSQTLIPFKDKHGATNYAEIDPETGSGKRIHDLSAHIRDYRKPSEELNPRSLGELAKSLVADYAAALRVSPGELRLVKAETDGSWWFAEMRQVHDGVPVLGSEAGFSIDALGRIVTLGARVYPGVSVSSQASLSGDQALGIAKAKFGAVTARVMEGPELAILPVGSHSKFTYKLGWIVTLGSGVRSEAYVVSAENGEILREESNVTESTVSGTVKGSYYPDKSTDAPVVVPFALPDIEAWNVSDELGSAAADATGHYTISMNAAIQQIYVRFALQNSLVQVRDNGGCDHLECDGTLVQPVVATLPGSTNVNYSFTGDGSNLYFQIPIVHDYFKKTFNYAAMDYQMRAHINSGRVRAMWSIMNTRTTSSSTFTAPRSEISEISRAPRWRRGSPTILPARSRTILSTPRMSIPTSGTWSMLLCGTRTGNFI
jgi:hypothetical protein